MGTGKSTFVSNLTGIKGESSDQIHSVTRKITLHSSEKIHALDFPGTEDINEETLKLIYDMTTLLENFPIAGIFLVMKSLSYRVDIALLSQVLLIASLLKSDAIEEVQNKLQGQF